MPEKQENSKEKKDETQDFSALMKKTSKEPSPTLNFLIMNKG
jgi:hypothetical protein